MRITVCVSDISTEMIWSNVKINHDNIEFLILHSLHKEATANLDLEIGQTLVKPSDTCCNLGVIFDLHMKMETRSRAYINL